MTEFDLPLIDISQFPQEIEGHRFQHQVELVKLGEVCKEWGFFRMVNHGIPPDLIEKAVCVTHDLLSMPVEVKDKVTTSSPMESYIRLQNCEVFYLLGMPNPQSIKEFSQKIWPEENSNFCEAICTLSLLLSDLSTKIIKLILASLGLDARTLYQSHFEKCKGKFQINGYSSHEIRMGDVVLPCHGDLSCLNILYNDENGGLQVQCKQGKWFNIKHEPDSFVVNIGDCFQAWSNSRYCSADHRVVYTGWKNRISLAYSINFPNDTQIWAPEELVDEDNPRRYKPFTFSALLNALATYQADAKMLKGIDRIAGIRDL